MNDRIHILYTEDDPGDAALTKRRFALDAPECDLDIVTSGRACLDRLGQHDYDLLLLDYRLPDIDGLEVIRIARRQGYTLPVVLMTGTGDEDVVVQAIRLGVSDYITKRGDYLAVVPQALRGIAEAYREQRTTGRLLMSSRQRILYVEHIASDIELAVRHFAQAAPHLTVQVAQSCGEALDLLRAAHERYETDAYDLVLTDLQMPDMSALDLIREARHLGISLPFVIVTGGGNEDVAVAALKMGVYDYVVKHNEYLMQLPHVIEHAIARFRLEREIAERQRTEKALAGAERLRRAILEGVEEGIHGLDLSGHIVFENPAASRMFRWQQQEMLGRHAHTLIHHHRSDGRPYPVEECPINQTLHDGRSRHVHDEVFFRKDGTSFPVEYTVSALRDEAGALVGVVVSFRDVTEYKQLEVQFLQSQKLEAVGELAGGIAHDFNNNLSAILGFSDLALDKLRPGDPLHRYITQVKKAGEQSAALTRQLLAFSRKQLLQPKVLDLNALMTDDQTMLQRMMGEHIELRLLLHPELGRIKADPGQMEQVLMNLVVNARDAMPEGGTLTLQTANVELNEAEAGARPPMLAGSYIRLTVADTGCGMDAATMARIFEPFFTTKALGKGTGLGLSTVYGIIKQSAGYIWVDSTPGQGTTFTIDLPRVEAPLEATLVSEVSTPVRSGDATVLLVEDDELVRTVSRETLQAQGYTVLEAMNGGAALLISERHQGPIDLLLTDVVMPYMSGPELAQRLTTQRPDMRVLYMSGYTNDMLAPQGVLQPDVGFLPKPFTPDLLLRTVQEVLETPENSAGVA